MNSVRTFRNPILPGFYPDPSICRVGEDYYLVTSSFAWFPGIPVFHSRDLINWKQLGHVLDRQSQLDLDGLEQSEGVFAPTIRYHKGIFYVINTNVPKKGNFIVTATDPAGPWSEPYWLEDAPGIDPSLFFDSDGSAWYVGTRSAPEGGRYYGDNDIWLQELDLGTMKLKGEKFSLWRGAMKNAVWPEGPHLYKIDGLYYLMISEGGTDYHHSVTIARSEILKGPYVGNPANPVLTHRHLGRNYPIMNTGHADLVETQNGEWWMVALASRPYGGYYRNLGRETFLAPVSWEEGWPIVSPGTGRIEFEYTSPLLETEPVVLPEGRDDFDNTKLGLDWNFIRTPREQFWSLTDRPGFLRLKLRPQRMAELETPSFVGRRQQHINFSAGLAMEFKPLSDNEAAGMVLLQNNNYYFGFEYSLTDGRGTVRLTECRAGQERVLTCKPFDEGSIYLKVTAAGQEYSFFYGSEKGDLKLLAGNVDGRILSTDIAGGFVGAYIGMYASSNGQQSGNTADFDWFEYTGA